ncbi:MAG: ABC transporter permease [Rickettsiales bacterium]|nr:ABC transporter permease [Rickettsiales bacterium]
MNIALEFSIALRYLQAKKKETFISITAILSFLGIMIGVAALVVVIAVMNGYREELSNKLKGFNSDITITSPTVKITEYKKITSELSGLAEVKMAIPLINEQALIINQHNESMGIFIKAIPMKLIKNYPALDIKNKKKNLNGIALGYNAGQHLGVHVGQPLKIMSLHFDSTVIGLMPKVKKLPVTHLFKSGMSEYDNIYAIIPLDVAQVLFNSANAVNKIEVFLQPGVNLEKTTNVINKTLGYQYLVSNWKDANQTILKALETERVVMFIILTFIIIVAAFNIISSLTMLVTDKTREIAILKTIGLQNASVTRIFLIAGMTLGFIGTKLGIGLGLLVAFNINEIKEFLSHITGTNLFDPLVYYLDLLPSKVSLTDTGRIAFISMTISFLATIYPSYKAGKTLPVEGLKND